MENQVLSLQCNQNPFPHLIVENFYDENELKLIWEELDFYTKPGKLLNAEHFGGVVEKTNSKALFLDDIYKDLSNENGPNYRKLSNILEVTRKVFVSGILNEFAVLHPCCSIVNDCNWDTTKVRYYHDNEYYRPHTDSKMPFLAFSYFYKEPKRFEGGDLIFPKYNYSFECSNNSVIIFPGWVEHGVSQVSIEDSDYYDGNGRYAITSFFGIM